VQSLLWVRESLFYSRLDEAAERLYMNMIMRTRARALLSISPEELAAIQEALAEAGASAAVRQCLAELNAQLESCPLSETEDADADLLNVWADGASVQVRAITAYADPVDLGSEEAREFAARILACAAEADRA
jgi:hypothetical protein